MEGLLIVNEEGKIVCFFVLKLISNFRVEILFLMGLFGIMFILCCCLREVIVVWYFVILIGFFVYMV